MSALTVRIDGRVAWLTLDKPPANAFDYWTYHELYDNITALDADDEVYVIVIKANGRFFSGGNDVNEFANPTVAPEGDIPADEIIDVALGSIGRTTKPVIALVQGVAAGSGFCVAAYADIVVATPEARFGIPEVKRGIVGGAPEAASVFPPKLARYLALTGDLIGADQAYAVGFVTSLVPAEQLIEEGRRIAESILGNPPLTVRLAKESLANIYPPDRVADQIAADAPRFVASAATEDYQEAIHSFLEKRPPVFQRR
ncbi:enoyl-CoA hydratase/isomerase family protein [Propionicicella superfundia]|uniref:enoyl-CoA hydratase/isomerase family protein n=1 Tax=Propionicicella superfundia TaxID=348582 RepID=UPI000403A519|nr:enoyl-CoA hydratase/isomerase family protein [Propionicicella superfundia]